MRKSLFQNNQFRTIKSFSQNNRNWQYWHQRLYYVKTKRTNNKMLPESALNLGTKPFGSDALLSGLLRHVLLGRTKIFIGDAFLVLIK